MTAVLRECGDSDPDQLPVALAWKRLAEAAGVRVGVERVPLAHACGRILARALVAPRDVPAFTNVAVDGFAIRHADLSAFGGLLRLARGRAAAGHPFARPLAPGEAVRVLTGAPLPEGADTVVMEEEAEVLGEQLRLPMRYPRGRGVRPAGEDIRAGSLVVAAGTRLLPHHLGIAASLGLAELEVYAPLRVALFSSGDELVEVGEPLPRGGLWDVNRPLLRGLLQRLPCRVSDLGILPDRAERVQAAVAEAAASHHAILTSGGASRGEEDHLARSLATLGRLYFWRVRMKPGRPLAAGELGGAAFIALPGNPVAAAVGFALFARPLLLAIAGAPFAPPRFVELPAAFSLRRRAGRAEFLRARLVRDATGRTAVERILREGSGILTALAEADGLVHIEETVATVEPGDPVPFASLAELGLG
ncbi:Molybdopterin molybdenumtransferase [bacterium HR40]|nr:Molybdopterin molybdenumtransferase [bacterium HR40]